MDFPSGHHPFASGQHHFASGENNCKKFFAIPQYPHPYIIFWQIKTPDFIFQLLSIISHPFGFILQQTPIQNYNLQWYNTLSNLNLERGGPDVLSDTSVKPAFIAT